MRRSIPTLVLLLASQLHAQPPGPVLKLTTVSGQTTFHIGERIPIVFSFTGPGSFSVSLLPVNRLSGLPIDDFSVSPANNTADPLALYLAYTGRAFSLRIGHSTLSSTPVTRAANLNEWVRFDAPGTYAVTATSHRVYPTDGKSPFGRQNGFKLPSNTLQLHIIPATPVWQKDTLTRALQELAKPAPENGDPSESRTTAIQDLRYLATPEAIAALAGNLSDDHYDLQRDAIEGLVGLPRSLRDVALAAMNRLIEDPHFPVCSQFFDAMAFLQLDDIPLPDFEHFQFGDEESEAKFGALAAAFESKKQIFDGGGAKSNNVPLFLPDPPRASPRRA